MEAYVYILASRRNGTLYTGATRNLLHRVWVHKNRVITGFSSRYSVTVLVYFERCGSFAHARCRERTIKRWRRAWKIELIERDNPEWRDLYDDL